jgi:hypothetical protein
VASEPSTRPSTVIFTAATTLPLAKPVQEIVIPEVGSRAVSSSPTTISG